MMVNFDLLFNSGNEDSDHASGSLRWGVHARTAAEARDEVCDVA